MLGLFRRSIKSRVMDVVSRHIAVSQKRFDDECTKLDVQHKVDVRTLHKKKELAKETLAAELVTNLVGKIIG